MRRLHTGATTPAGNGDLDRTPLRATTHRGSKGKLALLPCPLMICVAPQFLRGSSMVQPRRETEVQLALAPTARETNRACKVAQRRTHASNPACTPMGGQLALLHTNGGTYLLGVESHYCRGGNNTPLVQKVRIRIIGVFRPRQGLADSIPIPFIIPVACRVPRRWS